MNFKRAIWVSAVTYVVSFIIGAIAASALGFDLSQISDIPTNVLVVNIVITLILASLFTLFYFKDKKIKPSLSEGFKFGIVLVIIGFILDLIIFSAGTIFIDSEISIVEYYSNPLFWLAIILLLAASSAIGFIKEKSKRAINNKNK